MVSAFEGLTALQGRLRSLLPSLKPGHAAVVELMIQEPLFVLDATAQQIAHRAQVSAATVVRAVRSAGYSGLPELKKHLARATHGQDSSSAARSLSQSTTSAELTEVIVASHAESLRAVHGTLNQHNLARAISTLRTARRVQATAAGTSLPVAADAAFRLTFAGLAVQHTEDSYSAVLAAGLLTDQDTLIAVSHSGETPQTMEVVREAASSGATVIAITSYSESTLARAAEIALVALGSGHAELLTESSSRIAHLAVVDVLHAALTMDLPAETPHP
ncbi:MurR/RpiR family transcriptional regulator [Nesterenkonia ebinurensis]|uniref:MurR/RpiR family transcriptional regulator n=1 Tax=Nesterenkonia ebinurensis TaxID=2608252 RepID=UPI00168BA76B|nr:MurR/RpiR family transcriptional regulator [Nesterenkonia ebinurensis]